MTYRIKLALLFCMANWFLPMQVFAGDSSQLGPQTMTPVVPHVSYTNDCRPAPNVKADQVSSLYTATYGEQSSMCPAGYLPRTMKIYVAVGLNSGEWNWRLDCCKTKVSYKY